MSERSGGEAHLPGGEASNLNQPQMNTTETVKSAIAFANNEYRISGTENKIEPTTVQLLDHVESLFIRSNKDVVTVRDIVRLVKYHFGIPKLSTYQKKSIKRRLARMVAGDRDATDNMAAARSPNVVETSPQPKAMAAVTAATALVSHEITDNGPTNSQLLTHINFLFLRSNKDTMTVGDANGLVTSHFGIPKLNKGQKRLIKGRLTELIVGDRDASANVVPRSPDAIGASNKKTKSQQKPATAVTTVNAPASGASESNSDHITDVTTPTPNKRTAASASGPDANGSNGIIDETNKRRKLGKADYNWMVMYNNLKEYYMKTGHTYVSDSDSNFYPGFLEGSERGSRRGRTPKDQNHHSLAKWTSKQRTAKKQGTIRADREKLLDDIMFYWNHNDFVWDKYYNNIVKIMKDHESESVDIPSLKSQQNESNRIWGARYMAWADEQRLRYALFQEKLHTTITERRMKKLNDIGFAWFRDETDKARIAKRARNFHYGKVTVS